MTVDEDEIIIILQRYVKYLFMKSNWHLNMLLPSRKKQNIWDSLSVTSDFGNGTRKYGLFISKAPIETNFETRDLRTRPTQTKAKSCPFDYVRDKK